jgi:hypothetical protein
MSVTKVIDTLRSVSPTSLCEENVEIQFAMNGLNQVVIDMKVLDKEGDPFKMVRITLAHNQAMQAFGKVIQAIHP